MSKPTIEELELCLRDVINWEIFALHLPGISKTDIDIIMKNKPYDIVGQKLELYEKWLEVYPNASWDGVIQALTKVERNRTAMDLQLKYPQVETAPSTKQPEDKQVYIQEQVTVHIVDKLNTYFVSFTREMN